jgi:hypothetical protein
MRPAVTRCDADRHHRNCGGGVLEMAATAGGRVDGKPVLMTSVRTIRWSPRLVLGIALSLLSQGCGQTMAPPPGPGPGAGQERRSGVPPGAIEVGDQLYQVPIGHGDDGCPMYRLYSPSRLVSQVISYRAVGGGFTTDRRRADCTTGQSG